MGLAYWQFRCYEVTCYKLEVMRSIPPGFTCVPCGPVADSPSKKNMSPQGRFKIFRTHINKITQIR